MTLGTTFLWRGHQGPEFARLFAHCWSSGELLIACPPTPVDLSFVVSLPRSEVRLIGEWSMEERRFPLRPLGLLYPKAPRLGVFTTGTTSLSQKLVLYSRENIEASQDAIFNLFDARRIDVLFSYPQPYHVFGLLLGFALAHLRGLRIVAPEGAYGRSAHAAWLAEDSRRMLTLATPSHMLDLCSFLAQGSASPRPTYSCILGGAKVERRVWLAARDLAKIEAPSIGYGCTEASPGICHLPPGLEPAQDGEVGFPLEHATLDFASDEGFTLRGPSVCLATIESGVLKFLDSHLVRDDLRRELDGRLVFASRRDLLLNRGGEKFALEQIEALLKARHDIDAICVALPDARLGTELGIVARKTTAVKPAAIFETLAATYKRRFEPANLRFVEELPLNANAKLDRQAAIRMFDHH